MAFTNSNNQIKGILPVRFPAGCEVVAERFTLAMATGDLALNSIGQIGILPAGCVPVAAYIDSDDIDSSTAAVVFQLGIWDGASASLSTAAVDGGAAWGSSTASNTAFHQQILGQPMMLCQRSDSDRKLGLKVTTAPTTPVAGNVSITLLYRSA